MPKAFVGRHREMAALRREELDMGKRFDNIGDQRHEFSEKHLLFFVGTPISMAGLMSLPRAWIH